MTDARTAAIAPFLLALALATAPAGAARAQQPADLSILEIVNKAAPSLVDVETFDKAGDQEGEGTGFFIAPHLVLTNAHVVEGAFSLRVTMLGPKKKSDRRPRLLKSDPAADLALLQVDGLEGPVLAVEEGPAIQIGDRVVAYGNEYEGQRLVSEGIVRACLPTQIITSAPVHDGHSGSPLFDRQGRVIGIITSILGPWGGENMSFAIDRPTILKFLKAKESPKSFPEAGTSLFRVRLWRSVKGFFEDLFTRIFDLGESAFWLYLKLVTLVVLTFLVWKIITVLRGR